MKKESAIVIGAGIVGLAMARALAARGYQVTVLERHERAVGASVRNFGSLWPMGVPNGPLYQRAQQSRSIWLTLLRGMKIWHDPCGSLHVARSRDEDAGAGALSPRSARASVPAVCSVPTPRAR